MAWSCVAPFRQPSIFVRLVSLFHQPERCVRLTDNLNQPNQNCHSDNSQPNFRVRCLMVEKHPTKSFISGFGAAVTTTVLTFPINKIVYRQIIEGKSLKNVVHRMHKEGPFLLYRGVLPPMTQKAVSLSAMFGMFDTAVGSVKRFHLNENIERLWGSMASGTTEALLLPFERIQVLLVHPKYYDKFKNTFHTFWAVQREYGFKEFYRGMVLIWIRNTMSNTCFFFLKHEIQKVQKRKKSVYKEGLHNFFSGGMSGVMMAVLLYPLKVMKIIIHRDIGTPFRTIHEVAATIYKKDGRGIRNFYQGVVLNSARALLSWGIANMVFEFLKEI